MNISRYTVVVTRAASQSSRLLDLLMDKGFNALTLPLIQTEEIDASQRFTQAGEKLLESKYAGLIFSSANGVRFFHKFWKTNFPEASLPEDLRVFVQGVATAGAYQELFEKEATDLPEIYTSEALSELLLSTADQGSAWLMPSAEEVRHQMVEQAAEKDVSIELLPVYRTVPAEPSEDLVKQICEMPRDALILTFFSPSAFLAAKPVFSCDPDLLKEVRLVSIGPVTSSMIMESGYRVFLEAEESSQRNLVETLAARLEN